MTDKMYEYLLEHNYISRNKNKTSFRQQELSENRAKCIACKCNSLFEDEKDKLIKYLEDKIKECNNTIELLEGTNSHRISILQVQIKSYEDILERVESGNYE